MSGKPYSDGTASSGAMLLVKDTVHSTLLASGIAARNIPLECSKRSYSAQCNAAATSGGASSEE